MGKNGKNSMTKSMMERFKPTLIPHFASQVPLDSKEQMMSPTLDSSSTMITHRCPFTKSQVVKTTQDTGSELTLHSSTTTAVKSSSQVLATQTQQTSARLLLFPVTLMHLRLVSTMMKEMEPLNRLGSLKTESPKLMEN